MKRILKKRSVKMIARDFIHLLFFTGFFFGHGELDVSFLMVLMNWTPMCLIAFRSVTFLFFWLCGHCKKLPPEYEKVGASFKKVKSVLIGKVSLVFLTCLGTPSYRLCSIFRV
ncbi:unnamed protein product [Coffea canephora]|uniref:DH200=94 genomic scaffold, scaffold_1402 n=1 Tax=Coffea canephora TaxID=49390 RepID=A0A068VJ22_COFCA|nr:unnamed protein product [Coffea canephora]